MSVSNTHFGKTFGYHAQAGDLFIDCSAFSVAPIISINSYNGGIRIGLGPSLYFTKAWKSSNSLGGLEEETSKTKIGFMIDFRLRIPEKTRYFLGLVIQFRNVGKVDIGPFTANSGVNYAVLPKADVNYNHLLLGLGGGIRF